ncbi:MAG: hypothetical protein HY548_00825 [Elusimicrobia bacterium]|nr:hypothetical protein [Elusimicrobiota bacterium]
MSFLVPNRVSKHVFYPLWDLYDRSRKLRELRRLERAQWAPFELKEGRQWQNLWRTVAYAAWRCPFYRARGMKPPASREEFQDIPLIVKEEVRAHLEPLRSE